MQDDLDTTAAVQAYLQGQDVAARARASMAMASGTSGDLEAELRAASERTGVPLTSARAAPEVVKRRAVAAQDFEDMATRFPTTMGFLADPENARLAHDDFGVLSGLETVMRETAWAGRALAAGVPAFASGAYGVGQAAAEMAAPLLDPLAGTVLPENPLRRIAGGFAGLRKQTAALADETAGPLPPDAGIVRAGVRAGLQSVGQQLPALAATVATGNPVFALASAGLAEGGESFGKARDAGIPTLGSVIFGASNAAVEVGTEMLPITRLLGDLKAGSGLFKTLVRQAAAEVPGEQVATALQDLNAWAALNPEKPFADYLRERPAAAAQTLIATLVGVGVQTGAARAVAGVAGRQEKEQRQVQDAAAVQRVMVAAGESKLRERDPRAFADLVQRSAEEAQAPTEVYLDARQVAEALQQSGVTPEQAQAALPSLGDQLDTALATGGDVVLPLGEFAAGVAGSQLEQVLMQHVRTAPEALSQADAEQARTEADRRMRAVAEQAIADNQAEQAAAGSRDAVRQTVLDQLNQTGRFTADVNAAYAELTAQMFATLGQRLGVTAEDAFKQFPLTVQASGTFAEVLQQRTPAPAQQAAAAAPPAPRQPSREEIDQRKRKAVLERLLECLA